jgi:Na+/H+ antiporter NhaA
MQSSDALHPTENVVFYTFNARSSNTRSSFCVPSNNDVAFRITVEIVIDQY